MCATRSGQTHGTANPWDPRHRTERSPLTPFQNKDSLAPPRRLLLPVISSLPRQVPAESTCHALCCALRMRVSSTDKIPAETTLTKSPHREVQLECRSKETIPTSLLGQRHSSVREQPGCWSITRPELPRNPCTAFILKPTSFPCHGLWMDTKGQWTGCKAEVPPLEQRLEAYKAHTWYLRGPSQKPSSGITLQSRKRMPQNGEHISDWL